MTDRKIPLAAAICAVLQPASVALAQQAPDPTKLESVVVTATRREVNLQDVAQSVTALSTEDIAKQAFQSLDDVVGALPSVTLVNCDPGPERRSSCAASRPAPASTTPTARSRSTSTTSR